MGEYQPSGWAKSDERSGPGLMSERSLSGINDADACITFGTALLEPGARLSIEVERIARNPDRFRVVSVIVVGTLYDLYDFDNEAFPPAPSASHVQSGYGYFTSRVSGAQEVGIGEVRHHRVPLFGEVTRRLNLRFTR